MKSNISQWDAQCASYLFEAMYDRTKNLRLAIKRLKGHQFDTIVCSGVSGIVFASPLALMMKKNLVIVRKEKDGAHSTNKVESNVEASGVHKFIIVDDLIDSGKTMKRVSGAIREWLEDEGGSADCIGVYLYHDDGFDPISDNEYLTKLVSA